MAERLGEQFATSKLEWQRGLAALSSTMSGKAEKAWMDELESTIRAEVERLRAKVRRRLRPQP